MTTFNFIFFIKTRTALRYPLSLDNKTPIPIHLYFSHTHYNLYSTNSNSNNNNNNNNNNNININNSPNSPNSQPLNLNNNTLELSNNNTLDNSILPIPSTIHSNYPHTHNLSTYSIYKKCNHLIPTPYNHTSLLSIDISMINDTNYINNLQRSISARWTDFDSILDNKPIFYWITLQSDNNIKALGKATIYYPNSVSHDIMGVHLAEEVSRIADYYDYHLESGMLIIHWKHYLTLEQMDDIIKAGNLEQLKKAIIIETTKNLSNIINTKNPRYKNITTQAPLGKSIGDNLYESTNKKNVVVRVTDRNTEGFSIST